VNETRPKPPAKPKAPGIQRPKPVVYKPPCKVCRQIRIYLIFAVPIVFMIFGGIRLEFPEGVDMMAMVGYVFLGAFVLQVIRRIYLDYISKDRDE
jgi:hypothetical protein